ncbi:M15 family metallopeptidase [Hoeflea sp. G2-23]|uniref:M15 family metallopeptidase n=1 Tax=Hoeflea algicola TaxID=2983763 RepID=A0ABT3Z954_9HYPH|nr:M15 family metallopeptidase [Hoeflea algicola]MCY0148302.1 M15 family metallopeptidase [Hoeflea algicola]
MADNPLSRFAVGGATRPDSFSGMQPEFASALQQMFESAPPDIQQQLRVGSGFRSPEKQAELWQGALQKYGSPEAARKWVAPPGRSQHNHGNAADLKYLNDAARQWAHSNAANYGLAFPLSNEDWHVELAGARGRGSHAPVQAVQGRGAVPGAQPQTGPTAFGDAVAPRGPVDFGSAISGYLAQRQQRDEEAAAEQQRRALLFGGIGSMYG